jgi:hypothetical protein
MKNTSTEARQKIEPGIGSLRRKVYEFYLGRGMYGATDFEAESNLHIDGNTMRPIRGSLVKNGLLLDSGITRVNQNGNNCIVWRSSEEGMIL